MKYIPFCGQPQKYWSTKRSSDGYIKYTDEQRAQIDEYACLHGNTRATAHFSRIMKRKVNKSTVRTFLLVNGKERIGQHPLKTSPNCREMHQDDHICWEDMTLPYRSMFEIFEKQVLLLIAK